MVKKKILSHNADNCIHVKQEYSSDVEVEEKDLDDEFNYQFIPESNPIKSEIIDIKWENIDFDVKNEKYLNEDLSMLEDDKQHQKIIQHNLEDDSSFNTQSPSSSSKVRIIIKLYK